MYKRFIMIIIPLKVLFLSLFSALIFAQNNQTSESKPLVLTNVTVIDIAGTLPTKPDMTVIIFGDRITALGKTEKIRVPKDAQIIDGSGKFLIPGLWDMHVHTLSKGQPEQFFPLFIANGITNVRDMGGDLTLQQISQIKTEIRNGTRLGPQIMAAGTIVEGARPFWNFSVSVKTVEDAKQTVNNLVNNGADFLKLYNSLSRDVYFAIAAEAKQKRIPFVGHIPEEVTPLEASRTGQKSIEHLIGIKIEITRDSKAIRKQRAEARNEEDSVKARELFFKLNQDILSQYDANKAQILFREFARNGTWQSPTLVVLRSYSLIHDQSLRDDPRMQYMPLKTRESWSKMGGKPDAQNDEMQKRLYEQNLMIINVMRLANVKILAGTDTPNPYTYPGFSLHNELELFVKAGFTPMEALRTATINPARFFNLQNSLGTIEKSKIANLVLLEANPLENISNTQKIAAVVVNGKYLPKEELQKMLADVKEMANRK